MKYPFPRLSKKQKEIIDQLGAGNYSLSSVFPTKQAIDGLLERGIIERAGETRLGAPPFYISLPEYQLTIASHIQWCAWCAATVEEEV